MCVCLGLNEREISAYFSKVILFKGHLCFTSSTFHHCRHWRRLRAGIKSRSESESVKEDEMIEGERNGKCSTKRSSVGHEMGRIFF